MCAQLYRRGEGNAVGVESETAAWKMLFYMLLILKMLGIPPDSLKYFIQSEPSPNKTKRAWDAL